ncbi:MAG: ribE [Bacillota bacterium]|jgi:riboflavin synthase|nr:ribE [Bacillota bacterium]
MFTGIVEEVGRIESVTKGEKSSRLRIKAKAVLEGTKTGDSICTNGVCLTVTRIHGDSFSADVMAETMRKSNLGALNVGSKVNLERAVALGGRFGGHIVSGHIDGTGVVRAVTREDNAVWISISVRKSIGRYLVEKGSVTVDGVSLTVARTEPWGFRVSMIPHTQKETLLIDRTPGQTVNLECDLLAKYVEKLLQHETLRAADLALTADQDWVADRVQTTNASASDKNEPLSEAFLKENGFFN